MDMGGKKPGGKPGATLSSKNSYEQRIAALKNPGGSSEPSVTTKVTSENYRDVYLKQKAAAERAAGEKAGILPETPKPLGKASATQRMTSENYREIYLKNKAAEEAEQKELARKKALAAKKSGISGFQQQQKLVEESNKRRIEDNQRARARELQSQISYWKQQLGQGQFPDEVVNGNIQQLSNELGGIPSRLW